MHFYCTGTSFSRIEDPYLLCAVQLLRPGVKLPNQMQLANDSSGGLLGCCYQKVKAEVNKLLSTSNQYIFITSDAWSSILKEPIVNYMAVCPIKQNCKRQRKIRCLEWDLNSHLRVSRPPLYQLSY